MQYIAFDAHKHYTLASVKQADGRLVGELRIPMSGVSCGSFSSGVNKTDKLDARRLNPPPAHRHASHRLDPVQSPTHPVE